MDYSQLELFQIPNEYENNIFERAKKLKAIVQAAYTRFDLNLEDDQTSEDYAILTVNVKIQHIREAEPYTESSSPKMFIWQFIPLITLEVNGDTTVIVSNKDSLMDTSSKIIPKWINTFFTTNSFSKGEFKQLTKQYYTLELLNNTFSNTVVKEKIIELIDKKDLILSIDCKLFNDRKNEITSMFERDIINKIRNFYFNLKSFQKDNWYMMGFYDDFTNEDYLLNDLDKNNYIKSQIEMNLGELKHAENFTSLFQNDYLFLNNAEFTYEKANTDDWESSFIIDPSILNLNFDDIDLEKLNKQSEKKKYNELYCYTKYGGEGFIRKEIVLPNKIIDKKKLKEIIFLSKKLYDDSK